MEEENKLPNILECTASYALSGVDNQEITSGASNLLLDTEKLTLLPDSGETLLIPYRDIAQITKANYRIDIALVSKERLTLSGLGYKYEDFSRNFSNLNNEVILKDLLMNETILKSGVEADFMYIDENNNEKAQGQCEFRIYETSAVIISNEGNFIRIPYGDLKHIRIENYKLFLDTDYDESYLFARMGKELDICYKILNDLMNKLSQKIQMSLKELFPGYDSSVIRKAAKLMKDGRAARRIDIDAISPGLWGEMEKKLDGLGIKEQYEYLKSLAKAERMCIGIKRGLMGDLTGEYFWFLAPIISNDPVQPGNAIAIEATSVEGSSKATYFFKICNPTQYLKLNNPVELLIETDKAINKISRDLVAINFRREPIYLSDEQLTSSAYIGYRRSIARIPALQELRRLFIGRVMHHSAEQWKVDVKKLLASNMNNA